MRMPEDSVKEYTSIYIRQYHETGKNCMRSKMICTSHTIGV